jgi:Transporter associated domain
MIQEDGSFIIRGDASLEDVDTILQLKLEEESALKEFATLSGFLCMCAGEIPAIGDIVMSRGWCFEIENADDKRILLVKVERLLGEDEEMHDADASNNPIRNLLRLSNGEASSGEGNNDSGEMSKLRTQEMIEDDLKKAREANIKATKEVERLVASGQKKMSILKGLSESK